MIFRTVGTPVEENGTPPWSRMIAASLVIHAALLAGVWGLERYAPRRAMPPSVISVSLVGSLSSASLGSPAPPAPQKAPEGRPAAAPSSSPEAKARVSIPVPRAERKAVSINPSEVKAPERTPPVPQAEPKPSAPSSKAEPPGKGGRPGADSGPRTAAAGPAGGSGQLTAEEARYLQMLQERIEENWRTFLTEEEGVLGEVRIQIAPDGRVREFVFLKGSGQSHVDASIVNALKKVALAPPPASLADRPLILRFWPSGPRS